MFNGTFSQPVINNQLMKKMFDVQPVLEKVKLCWQNTLNGINS